jgi:hypothetical protein
MESEHPSYRTYGRTSVLGCCTFEWFELGGHRMVRLPPGCHEGCVEELRRAALHAGVKLEFLRDDAA